MQLVFGGLSVVLLIHTISNTLLGETETTLCSLAVMVQSMPSSLLESKHSRQT